MSKNYSIYALTDPENNSIFYVGRTGRNPTVRYDEHLNSYTGVSPKEKKIYQILESRKGVPGLVVLENSITSERAAFMREVFWIEVLSAAGSPLTNASIDFDGHYVLTDIPYASLPDQPQFDVTHYLTQLDCSNSGMDFFRTESLDSFTPTSCDAKATDYDFAKERSGNAAAGLLINSGLPITEEETDVLVALYNSDKGIDYLEEFFQRNRNSLIGMLAKRGIVI